MLASVRAMVETGVPARQCHSLCRVAHEDTRFGLVDRKNKIDFASGCQYLRGLPNTLGRLTQSMPYSTQPFETFLR